MFFEKELISFNILEIIEIDQENVKMKNTNRNFNALSFRFESDTHFKTENTEISISKNSVVYIPARLDYYRYSKVDKLIVIHFDTPDYQTQNIEFFFPENPQILADLFRKILNCWNMKEIGYQYKASAVLYEILAECHKQNHTEKSIDSKIKNSVDYILKNYKNSKISIKEIAECSFVSEVYFRKLFKKEYGISPQKYIISLRIQYARGLLSAGYYSLKEVAYLSGYNDYKYFSLEFKKAVGISPSEYVYNY